MKRTRHTREQVINKLREADAMLSAGPVLMNQLKVGAKIWRPASHCDSCTFEPKTNQCIKCGRSYCNPHARLALESELP
jgi:hypothetical protein